MERGGNYGVVRGLRGGEMEIYVRRNLLLDWISCKSSVHTSVEEIR